MAALADLEKNYELSRQQEDAAAKERANRLEQEAREKNCYRRVVGTPWKVGSIIYGIREINPDGSVNPNFYGIISGDTHMEVLRKAFQTIGPCVESPYELCSPDKGVPPVQYKINFLHPDGDGIVAVTKEEYEIAQQLGLVGLAEAKLQAMMERLQRNGQQNKTE